MDLGLASIRRLENAMRTLSLDGSWIAAQEGGKVRVPARVPGTIHQDLLKAGVIPDPDYRDNEKAQYWVGESNWSFTREFTVPAALLAKERVLLRAEGLDTMATIAINGTEVGCADNMFRTWEFDVQAVLRPGRNRIAVTFASALRYNQRRDAERMLPGWGRTDDDRGQGNKRCTGGWIRKQPCSFGWDWGVKTDTCGIWKTIGLVGLGAARIDHVRVDQVHTMNRVDCTVAVKVDGRPGKGVALRARILDGDLVVDETTVPATTRGLLTLTIGKPRLWWPQGLGDQPLYTVSVELVDDAGMVEDSWIRRIGLRTLVLDRHPDRWGESFQFVVNGQPFFAKGANWIPDRICTPAVTPAMYRQRLEDAAAANMNLLRVWGGGIYEADLFYELCDELGLCVWQDFMFACATYPGFDKAFRDNVRAEAINQVRRLRHHACIALWCGNNELEQGLVQEQWTPWAMGLADYKKLFEQVLGGVVAQEDPARTYWRCSPHEPGQDRTWTWNNQTHSGDAHLWGVWHGRQPFEWYRKQEHRFNSEFGFQSFPEPRTVASYTEPADRNITSYIMEYHQRSGNGNATIMHYMTDWFRLPSSFEDTLWLSQIQQGMAMTYAVEHWRRSMPRGMGTLYWQINDCWPVASWSSIDSFGRWKALHYMARRFYAPVLVSGVEDASTGTVAVHLTNELKDGFAGEVRWRLTTAAGKLVKKGTVPAQVGMMKNKRLAVIDCQAALAKHGLRDLLVWLEAVDGRKLVATNLVTFSRPKHLELVDQKIAATVKTDGEGFLVTLKAKHPALWSFVRYDGEARYDDNFVHVAPNRSVTIRVTPTRKVGLVAFKKKLTVRHLLDTCR